MNGYCRALTPVITPTSTVADIDGVTSAFCIDSVPPVRDWVIIIN